MEPLVPYNARILPLSYSREWELARDFHGLETAWDGDGVEVIVVRLLK